MGHVRQYSRGQVVESLEKAGFEIYESKCNAFSGSSHWLSPVVILIYGMVPLYPAIPVRTCNYKKLIRKTNRKNRINTTVPTHWNGYFEGRPTRVQLPISPFYLYIMVVQSVVNLWFCNAASFIDSTILYTADPVHQVEH